MIMNTQKDLIKEKSVPKGKYADMTDLAIMMVDDELTTMEIVQSYLEEGGYRKFVLVQDSTHAMRVMEESMPDLLLLDIVMPVLSGFDILSAVRVHPRFKHLPVIIMTSSKDSESKLRALDLGATDFLAKPMDKSELILRVRNTLAAKAYQDQLAYYDPITGLPNKQLFLERFDWALKESKRYNKQMALMNIVLDNFNRINSTIGPVAGDKVLQLIARRIEGVIRNVDVLGHSIEDEDKKINLFRTEGSAFSLLLDRLHEEENAAIVAGRIIQAIKEPLKIDDKDVCITASIGIATYPTESEDRDTLLQLAAGAKDYVKNKGGNSFMFSSSNINASYNKRISLETRLRTALKRNEFVLYYQPVLDARTGTIHGVEALVRWNSKDDGLVPPNDFIPLAEETGLIIPIGEWVLNKACTDLKKWHQSGRNTLNMSVNVSVKQFTSPDFFSMVKRSIHSSGVNPEFLKLEITESLFLDNVEDKIKIMKRLTDTGLKLSIDDFGTGYSSLSYLSKLPVDELKIDRSFIIDAVKNSSNRAIVLSVIFLSHCLGLTTVAEGVETKEQLNFLQKERCDNYQGYLFSPPVPEEELLKLHPPDK